MFQPPYLLCELQDVLLGGGGSRAHHMLFFQQHGKYTSIMCLLSDSSSHACSLRALTKEPNLGWPIAKHRIITLFAMASKTSQRLEWGCPNQTQDYKGTPLRPIWVGTAHYQTMHITTPLSSETGEIRFITWLVRHDVLLFAPRACHGKRN